MISSLQEEVSAVNNWGARLAPLIVEIDWARAKERSKQEARRGLTGSGWQKMTRERGFANVV
jgi:hypothetical protein